MSLLTQASLVLTPNAYKANKLYSIISSSGSGDINFGSNEIVVNNPKHNFAGYE